MKIFYSSDACVAAALVDDTVATAVDTAAAAVDDVLYAQPAETRLHCRDNKRKRAAATVGAAAGCAPVGCCQLAASLPAAKFSGFSLLFSLSFSKFSVGRLVNLPGR